MTSHRKDDDIDVDSHGTQVLLRRNDLSRKIPTESHSLLNPSCVNSVRAVQCSQLRIITVILTPGEMGRPNYPDYNGV